MPNIKSRKAGPKMPGLCHMRFVSYKNSDLLSTTIQTPFSHETMTARINMELKKHNATSGLFPAKDEKNEFGNFPPPQKSRRSWA